MQQPLGLVISLWRKLTGLWAGFKSDLALFAMLQVPWLLTNVLLAKAMVVRHSYPTAPAAMSFGLLFRNLAYDLLFVACVASVIFACRRFTLPGRWRGAAVVFVYCAFCLVGVLYYVDAGAFMRFGAPLSRDLLNLVLPLVQHSSKVISLDDPLIELMALSVAWPALLSLALWSAGRGLVGDAGRWARPVPFLVAALVIAGGLSASLPVNAQRERMLRRVSPITLLLPRGLATQEAPRTVTAENQRVLDGLLGPKQGDGALAFAPLGRKRRNVVIWVWESVGERFLRSHHPLGHALSPELDRLEARGAVRFSHAYVDCPLSAQSTFTLMTGMSPPANPGIYKKGPATLKKPTYLPALFKAGGYDTAFFNSSYLNLWYEISFLRESGFDVLEDANNLANRSRYQYQMWSIEGRALVDRFFEWRDSRPPDTPFYTVIWNVEGHYKYAWINMPPEYEKDDLATRYDRLIQHTDMLLGQFFEGLVARKLDRDTLIVVVGDHGQGLGRGEHAYDRFESLLVREDDIQVPLVFLHPDLPAGARIVATPANLADIYPTVLDLAGLDVPAGIEGAALSREYQPRVMVSRAMTWWPLSARAGNYKLLMDHPEDPPELYDVAVDPWEVNDISGRNPGITEALWAYMSATTNRHAREDPSFALFSASDWKRY